MTAPDSEPSRRVVAAPDKFRGTATAQAFARAVTEAASWWGFSVLELPMADGGEGTLDALGGSNRTSTVDGPLGDPVAARWRFDGRTAVIEMALASGLALVGGAAGNDAIAASSYGTGELITEALDAGARRIIVAVGGSATTDGGLGALRALYPPARLRGVELVVACDVTTRFVDAAETFAPQKGASAAQVKLLRRRLKALVDNYQQIYGVDVSELERAGSAGGLAGGLAAVGASLVSGFELVAEELGLDEALGDAALVVTGEGFLDAESVNGKVVGGVLEAAGAAGVASLVVVGDLDPVVRDPVMAMSDAPVEIVSLVDRYGDERARHDTISCVTEVVDDHLRNLDQAERRT